MGVEIKKVMYKGKIEYHIYVDGLPHLACSSLQEANNLAADSSQQKRDIQALQKGPDVPDNRKGR